ncbi:Prolyl 3,4-dihydroxylase TPA1 [Candida viswanathii]|uniref:uS12 prolyl 3,4-dihydroxylase n=1 Tax=Candida viswanathii TaxID=5486 RepID=A0A367XS61_9ASCO|nr:Prolyl 3,4-dihydroxylase TPA1 [Candida viswanathii]
MPPSKRVQEADEESTNAPDVKKQNTSFTTDDIHSFFNSQIWDSEFQDTLKSQIANSEPYRWGSISDLMDDALLRDVRKEVLSQIAFTEKETDIYKVFQLGDLANLSGLDWADLLRLPSLYKLRAAIYSQEFRDVISKVTGCGKLSGVKTDMSINTYRKGCHLLTHDDVIGSRRVSFILYLPEPGKEWKPEYGGSLRLFPSIVPNVPKTDYSAKFTPQFNQIAFFTVQPGLSFHDVEEVRVDKHRLSVQGWFHIPQPGEDGYVPGEQEETEARSTLQQLQSKELQEFDFPKPIRNDLDEEQVKLIEDTTVLNEAEWKYLSEFINPVYLEKEALASLNKRFLEESIVEINEVLNPMYAVQLRSAMRHVEISEPTPQVSTEVTQPWKVAVPPHKQRYMYIDGKSPIELTEEGINFANRIGPQEFPNFESLKGPNRLSLLDNKLVSLASFLKSVAFKKWIKLITSLIVTSEQVLVRRFRPGHDFILATTTDKNLARSQDEENVLLEATLNLTPTATLAKNWESGEFGGYELCMADKEEDEDDDPAVYKASDPNDDAVLFTNQCKWNSLTLMVRDPSVLKFIKYVSINAKGSRWDVSCQWNVKNAEEEEEEEEDDDQEE